MRMPCQRIIAAQQQASQPAQKYSAASCRGMLVSICTAHEGVCVFAINLCPEEALICCHSRLGVLYNKSTCIIMECKGCSCTDMNMTGKA